MWNIVNATIVSGLAIGIVYAVFAIGFTFVFGTMKALNIAHAGVFVVSAISGVYIAEALPGFQFAGALLIGGLLIGAILGALIDLVALRPLQRRANSFEEVEMSSFISTLAVFFMLESLAIILTHARTLRYPSETLRIGAISIGPLQFSGRAAVAALGAVVVLIVFGLLLKTRLGTAMRSVAANAELSRYLGINVGRVNTTAMAIAGAMSGIAGVLMGVLFNQVSHGLSHTFLLKGIVIVVIAGLGSLGGALIAAILLGITEASTVYLLGSNWRDIVIFAVLLAVLLVRPNGLFGTEERLQT